MEFIAIFILAVIVSGILICRHNSRFPLDNSEKTITVIRHET